MAQKRQRSDWTDDDPEPSNRASGSRLPRSRACAECKRHKIKCEMKPGDTACAKCVRSGIDCVPYDMSRQFIDQDAAWKSKTTADIQLLRTAVARLLQHNHVSDFSDLELEAIPTDPPANEELRRPSEHVSPPEPLTMTREVSPESSSDDLNLIPAPMRSLYNLTRKESIGKPRQRSTTSVIEEDFISSSVISARDAEFLFQKFLRDVNQVLWAGVNFVHTTLDSCRRSSSLLTAAVLTVAALHTRDKSDVLAKCYSTFVTLVCSNSLSRYRSLDDVRALLLAAFYLSNLSWKLAGQSVQIATEMNLHKAFHKLVNGDTSQHERARLWYTAYVCDHQFSIAYGRPPVTHDSVAIRNHEKFLQSMAAVPGDVRLMAQVALFRILTEAFTIYADDLEKTLSEDDLERLTGFNFEIEQWRFHWQKRSADSPQLGSYPSKGVVLYYHFARFQINSLALRGIPSPNICDMMTPPSSSTGIMADQATFKFSLARREAANIAVSSAINTLTLILDEPDIRDVLIGTPIFTHTMVAFCTVFLIKLAATWGSGSASLSPAVNNMMYTQEGSMGAYLSFNAKSALALVRRSVEMLSNMAEKVSEKHLVNHIADGCKRMLEKYDTVERPLPRMGSVATEYTSGMVPNLGGLAGDVFPSGDNAIPVSYDLRDMAGTYGFGFDETFLGQNTTTGFDFWSI